jgi:hypothetical protein
LDKQYEQATVLLPNGKPISLGVPVLEPRERPLDELFQEMHARNPRRYASKAPTGRKPGTVACALCGQSAGTLVRVEAQGQQAYVHADCGRDVAAQRMNRIGKLMRETAKATGAGRAGARKRARR